MWQRGMMVRSVAALVATAGVSGSALGWNQHGHMMIAYLAYQHLTEAQRQSVVAILKGNPKIEAMLSLGLGEFDNTPEAQAKRDMYIFMRAAYWADMIRDKSNEMNGENRPTWHYIDFPFVLEGTPGEDEGGPNLPEPPTEWTPGTDPITLPQAIEMCLHDAKEAGTAAEARAIRLCWLLHLIGDMHQPLHSTSMYSARYFRGDRGGNMIVVRAEDQTINLHALWDNMAGLGPRVGEDAPGAMSGPPTITELERAEAAAKAAVELAAKPEVSGESLGKELQIKTMLGWLGESKFLAQQVVYAGGTFPKIDAAATREDPAPVPEGYMSKAREVSDKQVVLAGHRLAEVLKQVADAPR